MITPRSFTENVIALPSLLKVDRKDLTLSFPFLQLSEEVSMVNGNNRMGGGGDFNCHSVWALRLQ